MRTLFLTCFWQDVEQILVASDGSAKGVALKDGTEINSKVVLSNATPYVTFRNLTPQVSFFNFYLKTLKKKE